MIFADRVLPITFALAIAFAEIASPKDANYDYEPPAPGSYTLPVVKIAPDGAIVDSHGTAMHLRDLTHGRITVMSFVYTRCAAANACPYATGVMYQLHRLSTQDEALGKGLRLVSMSFDPEHDTPTRLAAYAEGVNDEQRAGCEWWFATAKSHGDLESILTGYGQAVDKRRNQNDPQGPLYHILRVFLIDRQGRIRNIYGSGTLDPRLVIADVKTLLMDEPKVTVQ